mgnify:CR=1 FL=1
MLASIFAAKKGCEVTLFEKNEKLGKKLYITGKGRCNVTNNCDPEELLNSVVTNAKFLYSAFYTFTSQDMMEFLEEAGTSLKTERGNRVFPCSDHSSDVIRALERQMKKYGVRIHLKSQVERLLEIRRKLGITTGGIPTCAGVNEADVQGQRRSSDELSESLNLKGVTRLIRPGDVQQGTGERPSAPDKSKEEIIGEVVRRVLEQLKQNH